jgi:hypothetical protein
MAFNISHQPNLASYAKAVEGASRNVTANQRLEKYASYLAGVQKANQDYGLGVAGLGIEQQKVDQGFDIDKFRVLLDEKKFQADVKSQGIQDKATLMNAYSEQNRAHAALMGAHKTLFLG